MKIGSRMIAIFRSNNPNFDSYYEWNTSIDEDKVDLLQSSFFAFELWCSTNESDDQLLGLGRVSTAGLSSILVGGYSLLCSPRYPVRDPQTSWFD